MLATYLLLAAPLLTQSPSAPPERMTAGAGELELALEPGAVGHGLAAQVGLPAPTAEQTQQLDPWPQEWSEDDWSSAEPWRTWAAALVERGDASRAQLAQLAHRQGRWDDAWQHAASISDPRMARAILPRLFPGVPADAGPADGLAQPLPNGVLLRPSLPPPTAPVPAALTGPVRQRRAMEFAGVRVGEATLHLRLALEGDGVQIDVTHVSGGPCRLQLVIPEPQGFEIRVEYVDWDRRETVGEPHELEINPGDEPHKLWGRFLRFSQPWPQKLPSTLPAQAAEAGLVLVDSPSGASVALLDGFAEALHTALGIPTQVTVDRGSVAISGPAPVRLHLGVDGERLEKIAAIQSLVEQYVFTDS